MGYEIDKVYLTRLKTNWYGKKGDIVRCKRKAENDNFWTLHESDFSYNKDGFNYMCSVGPWLDNTEKPFDHLTYNDFIEGKYYICIEDYNDAVGNLLFTKGKYYRVFDKWVNCVYFSANEDIPVNLYREELPLFWYDELSHFWYDERSDVVKSLSSFGKTVQEVKDNMIKEEDMNKKRALSNILRPEKKYSMCDTYHFKSDRVNFDLLCNDMLKDNIPCSIVTEGALSYIVFIKNKKFSIINRLIKYRIFAWTGLTHDIISVNTEDMNTKEFKERLKNILEEYSSYTGTLLETERKRSKGVPNKYKIMFKVTTYK